MTQPHHNTTRHDIFWRVHALQRAMDPASGAAPKRSSKRKLKVKGPKLQELGVIGWECLEYPACYETSSLIRHLVNLHEFINGMARYGSAFLSQF